MTPSQLRESFRRGWASGVGSAGQYQLGEADDKLAFDRGFAEGRRARLTALRRAIELWPDGIPGLQPPASPLELRTAELTERGEPRHEP